MNKINLRKEAYRKEFRKQLIEKLGLVCFNCGSDEEIEFHHIVPISLNGTNNPTNFAPLCSKCHQYAHGSVNIREIFRSNKTGRPKKQLPNDYEKTLWMYLKGEIGLNECKKLIGAGNSTHLKDTWYFNKFLKDNGIKSVKNKVDLILSKSIIKKIPKGRLVSIIVYENGFQELNYQK